jgi:hypothetical protein
MELIGYTSWQPCTRNAGRDTGKNAWISHLNESFTFPPFLNLLRFTLSPRLEAPTSGCGECLCSDWQAGAAGVMWSTFSTLEIVIWHDFVNWLSCFSGLCYGFGDETGWDNQTIIKAAEPGIMPVWAAFLLCGAKEKQMTAFLYDNPEIEERPGFPLSVLCPPISEVDWYQRVYWTWSGVSAASKRRDRIVKIIPKLQQSTSENTVGRSRDVFTI